MNNLYYVGAENEDGEDLSVLAYAATPCEAVRHWRGYYELDEDAEAPAVFLVDTSIRARNAPGRALAWTGEELTEVKCEEPDDLAPPPA